MNTKHLIAAIIVGLGLFGATPIHADTEVENADPTSEMITADLGLYDRLTDYDAEDHNAIEDDVEEEIVREILTKRSDVLEVPSGVSANIDGLIRNKNQGEDKISVTTPMGAEEVQTANEIAFNADTTKVKHAGIGGITFSMKDNIWLPIVGTWILVALFVWTICFYGILRYQQSRIKRMMSRSDDLMQK